MSTVFAPYYGGGQAQNPANVIQTSGAPSTNFTWMKFGTLAVDPSTGTIYGLASKSGGTATWAVLGGGSGAVATLTGGSGGAISPSGGNITLAGTANQITTTGAANTITWSLPNAITAPGSLTTTTSLAATTTVTAGTGITATTGNIAATAGNVTAGAAVSATTTVTAGTGITATTGNIAATAGNVTAGAAMSATTTVTAGTGITSTTGDIVATAGAVNAGTSMTATAGDITATLGHVIINGAAKQLRVHGGAVTDFIGQATLTNGTVTVANTNIAATDRVFVTRSAKNASTAYGTFEVTITAATNFVITSCKADTTTETNDVSTVDYFIVRQV